MDGTTALGKVTLVAAAGTTGAAALMLSTLTAGTHNITAVYSGDANVAGSSSPATAVVVNVATTTVVLTPSATTVMVGTNLTLSAAPPLHNPGNAASCRNQHPHPHRVRNRRHHPVPHSHSKPEGKLDPFTQGQPLWLISRRHPDRSEGPPHNYCNYKRRRIDPMSEASTNIDARIEQLADWRGQTLAHVRRLILAVDPEIVEEWKWRGVPVWSRSGILCTGETYKAVVKLTFAKGAALPDPAGLFNSSLEGNVRRAIDLKQHEPLNGPALQDLIRAAITLNLTPKARTRPAKA